MKWIVIILGPNHHAKDLRQLLQAQHTNLNIIVILITNSNSHQIAANQNKNSLASGPMQKPGELEVLEEDNADEEKGSDEDEDSDEAKDKSVMSKSKVATSTKKSATKTMPPLSAIKQTEM